MSTAKRKLRLVKLKKYNTIWHPDSTLVFKSQKERFVIGRLVDKELVPLDDEAIELAEQWKLKIDESLLESGSESDEKEDEDQNDDSHSEEKEESEDESSQNNEETTEDTSNSLHSDNHEEATVNNENTLTNEIIQNARKTVDLIIELETKLDTVCKEKETLQLSYDDLKTKYDTIMNKFNTMKSLFN